MSHFFSRLNYSFGNEDHQTELKALQIRPEDRVVCITASGDRPLNLLTTPLKSLCAVDANPIQNALFDLKRVALRRLGFEEYLAFLGASASSQRLTLFTSLEKELLESSRSLWNKELKKIESGVLYSGYIEKWMKHAAQVIRFFHGKKIKMLFSFEKIEDQRQFMQQSWPTKFWRTTFRLCLHPSLTRLFITDPGLYQFLNDDFQIGSYIYERIDRYLHHSLAQKSLLLSLIFKGQVSPRFFPPYLQKSGVHAIRQQLDRVSIHTIDMISFLQQAPDESFDCFSLSDIASYLTHPQFIRLVEEVYRTARPGARFCIRQYSSNHQIPIPLAKYFERNQRLEKQLADEDNCFVYRFLTGKICKEENRLKKA